MAIGVQRALPEARIRLLPLADGGDGSVDALVAAGFRSMPVTTRGPTGAAVEAHFALRDGTAVVEIANTCGLLLLPARVREPLASSSRGLGDAIIAALDAGARTIVICLGGSASTDGGAGLLVALGARVVDAAGETVEPCGASLGSIRAIDLAGIDPRAVAATVIVATDVDSPLVGSSGAAAVFAPQKGATPEQVAFLDAGLRTWADVLERATGIATAGIPGSGAAGGTAAGAIAALGATVRSGADLIREAIGLPEALATADLVITGEGRVDRQSLLGKGALSLARTAAERGLPVLVACGSLDLEEESLWAAGVRGSTSLVERAPDRETAMAQAAELLAGATDDVVRRWLRSRPTG